MPAPINAVAMCPVMGLTVNGVTQESSLLKWAAPYSLVAGRWHQSFIPSGADKGEPGMSGCVDPRPVLAFSGRGIVGSPRLLRLRPHAAISLGQGCSVGKYLRDHPQRRQASLQCGIDAKTMPR
eukprot:6447710-Karenia_brevis.AAC.1